MRHFYLLIGLLLIFLIGCGKDSTIPSEAVAAIDPTATYLPTPTLLSGAPTNFPASPTSETAVSASTPLPTVTPLPTASPTPQPAARIEIGNAEVDNGNFDTAIAQFEAGLLSGSLDETTQSETLYELGIAYFQDGRFPSAINSFNELLRLDEDAPSATHFYLGQAYEAMSDYQNGLNATQTYLAANPEMAAYIGPTIAEMELALGNRGAAIAALETAVSAPAHRLTEIDNRTRLLDFQLEDGNLAAAITQYDAIHDLAFTEFTQGQMNYLAGMAELQLGNVEAANGRFLTGIRTYPRAYESYLGLVQLVEANIPVDEFQRGLVNYFANSYDPCIAAFSRYTTSNPEPFQAEAYLFQAYCYEGLDNGEMALQALISYAELAPTSGLIERAKMLARLGNVAEARDAYLAYRTEFPNGEDAALAAWQTSALTEQLGEAAAAIAHFVTLADQFPMHEDAAEALFRAGWLANGSGNEETAVSLWQRAAASYPNDEYGIASFIWQWRTLPDPTITFSTTLAVNYYALRATELLSENEPFKASEMFRMPTVVETAVLQADAEEWLRELTSAPIEADIRTLSPTLVEDGRLIRGDKLWQLGLFESAKRELESLRVDVVAADNNKLFSYQLALYFQEIGLYRSSILAATTLLNLTGETIFTAPRFIGQLAYPAYYADQIVPLAGQYNFDPRLQFALVRQESLFESFARSGAAAQGLSQVIPDTGAYIAQRLNWPNYSNDDLYKPYVGLNFGAFYLAQQITAFNGDIHAALSAYNAGPGNAARWHAIATSDLDLYIETVDFWETRLYIERIYLGYQIYTFLYDGNSES